MLRRLKGKGLRICVWINPYIAQKSRALRRRHGDRATSSGGPTGASGSGTAGRRAWASSISRIPEAVGWYQDKLRRALDMGVDCFKTDFGERIPTDVVYHDGSDPERMHNYYTYLYNRAVFEFLEGNAGTQRALLFARSATAGSQKFPVHWGGDSRPPTSPWRRVCAAVFRSAFRGSGSGATTSRVREDRHAGPLQALGRVRPAVLAQPAARQRVLPRALALRRGVHGCPAVLRPAEMPAHAVPLCRGRRGFPGRHAHDARHGPGVPRRIRPAHSWTGSTCSDLPARGARSSAADGTVSYYLPPGRWTNILSGNVIGRWLVAEGKATGT